MGVTRPTDHAICVCYDVLVRSQGFQLGLKQGTTLAHEINAVSFVLKDASGSIVVLGRRANWQLSDDGPTDAEIDLAGLRLNEDPTFSYAYPDIDADELEKGRSTFGSICFGQVVTVSGQVYPSSSRIVWPSDELADKALPSAFVIGPGRFLGLKIRPGG